MASVWRVATACALLALLAAAGAAAGPLEAPGLVPGITTPPGPAPSLSLPAVPDVAPQVQVPAARPVLDGLPVPDLGLAEDGVLPGKPDPDPPVQAPPKDSTLVPGVPDEAVATGAGFGLAALALVVLWKVLGASPLALFSRIREGEVLDHATRNRILDLVNARPGIHLKELQADLGIAWGTLVHHVRRLEATGHLVSMRQGPRRLLYAANTPESRARQDLALLRNGTAFRIAATIQQQPGIRQGTVCDVLELQPASVSKHASRLEEAGLIEVPRDDGRPRYLPTERLHLALQLAAPLAEGGLRLAQVPSALPGPELPASAAAAVAEHRAAAAA